MNTYARNARQYNEQIKLVKYTDTVDAYGRSKSTAPTVVAIVPARVRQMSASKAALTFQPANIVGLDFEMRATVHVFDAVEWRGHAVSITAPEDVDGRGRVVRFSGFYQKDKPVG